jgi:hypothetical protein
VRVGVMGPSGAYEERSRFLAFALAMVTLTPSSGTRRKHRRSAGLNYTEVYSRLAFEPRGGFRRNRSRRKRSRVEVTEEIR